MIITINNKVLNSSKQTHTHTPPPYTTPHTHPHTSPHTQNKLDPVHFGTANEFVVEKNEGVGF